MVIRHIFDNPFTMVHATDEVVAGKVLSAYVPDGMESYHIIVDDEIVRNIHFQPVKDLEGTDKANVYTFIVSFFNYSLLIHITHR